MDKSHSKIHRPTGVPELYRKQQQTLVHMAKVLAETGLERAKADFLAGELGVLIQAPSPTDSDDVLTRELEELDRLRSELESVVNSDSGD